MRYIGFGKMDTMEDIASALLKLNPLGQRLNADQIALLTGKFDGSGKVRDILLVFGDNIMSAMFEIHPKVIYDVPYDLMKEFGLAKSDPRKLPSSLVRLPHRAIYVYSDMGSDTIYDAWMGEFTDAKGVRNLMFYSPTGYAVISLDLPTIGECVAAAGVPITGEGIVPEELLEETFEYNLRMMINLCLYLTGGDVEERTIKGNPYALSPQTGKKAKASALRKPTTYGVVGGKFMSAWNHYTAALSSESNPTGRSVRPHLRAGHWHLYWTGEGRTIPKVVFLHPCMVNAIKVEPSTEIERIVKAVQT